jgi:hypothetical protein
MSLSLLHRVTVGRVTARSLGVAAVVGFLIFGCSTFGTAQKAPPATHACSAKQCTVPVVVTCTPAAGCAITSPIMTDNIDANGFDVVWQMVQAGTSYTFKNAGGIFFKTAEGQRLFKCHSEGTGGTRFKCHSDTKDAKPYEYGIELAGTPPVSLDPWIVNR